MAGNICAASSKCILPQNVRAFCGNYQKGFATNWNRILLQGVRRCNKAVYLCCVCCNFDSLIFRVYLILNSY